jgi:hypothetical protein
VLFQTSLLARLTGRATVFNLVDSALDTVGQDVL